MANLSRRLKPTAFGAVCLSLCLWLGACADPRPTRTVPENAQRLKKSALRGEFIFAKTITKVETPSEAFRSFAPGVQLEGSRVVGFEIRESHAELYSLDPIFEDDKPIEKRRLLASFPVKHVDVLPTLNSDGDDTHIEEETELRRPWQERDYVVVDWTHDATESWPSAVQRAVVTSALQLPADSAEQPDHWATANGWTVDKAFADGTTLEVRYQLLQVTPGAGTPAPFPTQARPYPKEDQLRFGFLKKTEFGRDRFGRYTRTAKKESLVKWETTKPIRFFVNKTFPTRWKPLLRQAVNRWRDALRGTVGDPLLELVWDDESAPGDLSKNQIYYDDSAHDAHGLLGYAPVVWDPRNANILKADIYLYGPVIQRALYFDELWRKSLKFPAQIPEPPQEFLPQQVLSSNLDGVKSWQNPQKAIQATREYQARQGHHCFVSMQESWITPESMGLMSVAELESAVIGNLLFHELGHTLGLRHNFMGSVDVAHHGAGFDSSTVMDYPLAAKPVTALGAYDKAAVRYAYSRDPAVQKQATLEGYYYCSDEDRLSSRLGLCQAYDQGGSLTEMIRQLKDRYFASFWVYHPRWDQMLFPKEAEQYDRLLMALLLPIRNAHDNADALIRAAEYHDYESVWNVAGQRVESDYPCDNKQADKDCFEIEVRPRQFELHSGGWDGASRPVLKRYLDQNKIRAALNDAVSAKTQAVLAYREILFSTRFPDHDVTDPEDGTIILTGVLRDKLAAASLLAVPLPDPLDPQRVVTPFSTDGEQPVAGIFAHILSNTLPPNPESDEPLSYTPTSFDMHLRRHALHLLVEQLIRPGHSPEARELLSLQTLPWSETEVKRAADASQGFYKEWVDADKLRTSIRELFFTRFYELSATERLTPSTRVAIEGGKLQLVEIERMGLQAAFTEKSDSETYRAPVRTRVSGLPTATGLLIRDNINRAEDRMKAAEMAMEKLQRDVFTGDSPSLNALMASPQLKGRLTTLAEYLAQERLFLEQIQLALSRSEF
jgi:hypothetical protein